MSIIKTVWNTEYKLIIDQDECAESPREWSNVWTLVTAHRNYSWDEELPHDCADMDSAFEEHLSQKWLWDEDIFFHKVWLMDHGWISIQTSPYWCRFDSWHWWYIYTTIKNAEEEFGMSTSEIEEGKNLEDKALEYLDNEIKILNKYYSWNIYQFIIESREIIEKDWKKFHDDWDVNDSCWWFYEVSDIIWHIDSDIFSDEEIKNYDIN